MTKNEALAVQAQDVAWKSQNPMRVSLALDALAARVWELEQALVVEQSEVEALAEQRNDWKAEAEKFLARVRELEARACDTCDNQRIMEDNPKNPWCSLLTLLAGGKRITCYEVDQGCNAWKGKA